MRQIKWNEKLPRENDGVGGMKVGGGGFLKMQIKIKKTQSLVSGCHSLFYSLIVCFCDCGIDHERFSSGEL